MKTTHITACSILLCASLGCTSGTSEPAPQARGAAAAAEVAVPPRPDTPAQAELERVSEEIKAEVAALRGLEFRRPVQVRVTDKQGFLEYARKRQEISMSPGRIERDETIAKLLGLLPRDLDLVATLEKFLGEQVGGFYDPSSNTFFLMDTFTGGIAKVILAHELTHALDDQYFDIDGTLKKLEEETDAEFAFQAVVEGSGTATMNQWTFKHMKELDFKDLAATSELGSQGLDDAPVAIWKPLIAAYLCGEGFLTRTSGLNMGLKAAKNEDLRQAFEHPPRSSEQILHPAKYWDEAQRDEPRAIRFDASKIADGWKVVGEDTLGELQLAIAVLPKKDRKGFDAKNPLAVLGLKFTNPAAEGWGGDRALLLAKDDERCLDLVTVWDSAEDAREFHEALQAVAKEDLPSAEIELDPAAMTVELRVCRDHRPSQAGMPDVPWHAAPKSGEAAGERR
jgi:hypothetical protein